MIYCYPRQKICRGFFYLILVFKSLNLNFKTSKEVAKTRKLYFALIGFVQIKFRPSSPPFPIAIGSSSGEGDFGGFAPKPPFAQNLLACSIFPTRR